MGGNNTDLSTDCSSTLNTFSNASKGLSSAFENVTMLARRVEQRFKELETKEEQLNRLSELLSCKRQELELMEAQLKDREGGVSQRESYVVEKEEGWNDIQKRMKMNVEKWDTKIHINVGGQDFATSKSTLLEYKGSFFEALLASDCLQASDSMFFIDRDPKYFSAILNFMRDGKVRNSDIRFIDLEELEEEFIFYKIPFPVKKTSIVQPHPQIGAHFNSTHSTTIHHINTPPIPAKEQPPIISTPASIVSKPAPSENNNKSYNNSATINNNNNNTNNNSNSNNNNNVNNKAGRLGFEGGNLLSLVLRDQIRCWIPNNKFVLIYKASRDGFKSKHFHKLCDNKGPTLVIIQSVDSHLFGGYSANSWDSNSNYVHSPTSFIFTLTNPHSIPPTRYFLKKGNNQSIRCQSQTCAVFGDGDIKIENNAHTSLSYSYFPASYYDTTEKRKLTFNGTQGFLTKEVEVYSVVAL